MSSGEIPAGARDVCLLLHDCGYDGGPALRHLQPPAGPPQRGHPTLEQLHTAGLGAVAAAQPATGGVTQSVVCCLYEPSSILRYSEWQKYVN